MSEDFQASASEQGRQFEDACIFLLKAQGWGIVQQHATVAGVEVDIIADDPTGLRWWIECKGSWRGTVPGMKRGDTAKKAIAVAWYLRRQPDGCPYLLLTSHLPKESTVAGRMLAEARSAGLFDRVLEVGFLIGLSDDEGDE